MKYLKILIIFIFFPLIGGYAQERTYSGLAPDGRSFRTVTIKDGQITNIEKTELIPADHEKIYLTPGFFDVQINGYASVSFNTAGLTKEKIRRLTEVLWSEGVTTFFPTIITNPEALIIENLKVLESASSDPLLAHSMPGYFLEGPYISEKDGFRGAHNAEWVRDPDWEEFQRFYKASDGRIIQIGLAPEKPGAMDFIRNCVDQGVMVALAHHNGTASQIQEAVELGARVSTHLGNGCANFIHRHDNPIWPQLAEDNLTATIIADGHHLRKQELQVFFKVKGPDRLILVSDATELAGMPPGEYDWNGKTVVMTADGMLQYPEQQVLAGASFPVRRGVINMVNLAGVSLENAVKMVTETPARVYGMQNRGRLEKGKSADLVLFSIDNNELIIHKTIVQGEEVYSR